MKLRTLALALALTCGFTALGDAKNRPTTRVQPRKVKARKTGSLKPRKMKVVKHKVKR